MLNEERTDTELQENLVFIEKIKFHDEVGLRDIFDLNSCHFMARKLCRFELVAVLMCLEMLFTQKIRPITLI